ncbi:MAG: acyl-CoA thioesterase [Spirochaetaceae bacterium]|jgi:acyl-CoA thioester hydrolase|nr:acyl-CoA thioesterase [Spirochaetaceae bacterium]
MFIITVSPRFGDIDGLGHINNTVLAGWFELGRNPIFRFFEPDLNLSHDRWTLIMAHTDYDFVGELFFQYDVEIRTAISRIGSKSFTVCHEARQEGRICVKGSAVVVHYDFIRKATTPIPEDKKKLLAEHLAAPEQSATTPI